MRFFENIGIRVFQIRQVNNSINSFHCIFIRKNSTLGSACRSDYFITILRYFLLRFQFLWTYFILARRRMRPKDVSSHRGSFRTHRMLHNSHLAVRALQRLSRRLRKLITYIICITINLYLEGISTVLGHGHPIMCTF